MCRIVWYIVYRKRKEKNKMSRRIRGYEHNPTKDENGKYIYPDLKRRTFLSDEATETKITKIMNTKHWTYSTFIRLAIDYFIEAIENDDLDELAGRL